MRLKLLKIVRKRRKARAIEAYGYGVPERDPSFVGKARIYETMVHKLTFLLWGRYLGLPRYWGFCACDATWFISSSRQEASHVKGGNCTIFKSLGNSITLLH